MTSVFPLGSCCCSSKASQSLSRTSWPCWLGFCWPTATSLPPSWAASSMRTWWKKVHGSWANVQFRLITIVKITTGVEWTFDFCHFQSTHLLLTWEKRGCIFTIITPLSPHPPFLHNVEFNSFFCYGRNIWSVVFFGFFLFVCFFMRWSWEILCERILWSVCVYLCIIWAWIWSWQVCLQQLTQTFIHLFRCFSELRRETLQILALWERHRLCRYKSAQGWHGQPAHGEAKTCCWDSTRCKWRDIIPTKGLVQV